MALRKHRLTGLEYMMDREGVCPWTIRLGIVVLVGLAWEARVKMSAVQEYLSFHFPLQFRLHRARSRLWLLRLPEREAL